MGRLIRMDFRRLFYSKIFWIAGLVLFLLKLISSLVMPILTNWLLSFSARSEGKPFTKTIAEVRLDDTITSPFGLFMIIILFVAVVSFCYADLANGYIKNIAGQIPNKGNTALSKFVVIMFHSLVYIVLAALGTVIGTLISPDAKLITEMDAGKTIILFCVRFALIMALCSMILFVVSALRSKVFGTVLGVLFGLNALNLIYMGLDSLIGNVIKDVHIENYTPSTLLTADLAATGDVVRALIVAIVFIAVFLFLSVKFIKEKDVQ